jgi:hypothetical protein
MQYRAGPPALRALQARRFEKEAGRRENLPHGDISALPRKQDQARRILFAIRNRDAQ